MLEYLIPAVRAVVFAGKNRMNRKLVGPETGIHPDFSNFIQLAFAPLVLAILVSIFSEWKLPTERGFWLALLCINLPAELFIWHCESRAYKYSPQSVVGPLRSLTIVFIIPVGMIVLGEMPTKLAIVGLVVTTIGALFIGWDLSNPGIRNALRNILRDKGALYSIFAALGACATIVGAKFVVQYVHTLEHAFFVTTFLVSWAYLRARKHMKEGTSKLQGHYKDAFAISILYIAGMTLHYMGLSLLYVAYYTAIQRMSIIFDVIFGWKFGKETNILPRLLGAILMVAGVVLVMIHR